MAVFHGGEELATMGALVATARVRDSGLQFTTTGRIRDWVPRERRGRPGARGDVSLLARRRSIAARAAHCIRAVHPAQTAFDGAPAQRTKTGVRGSRCKPETRGNSRLHGRCQLTGSFSFFGGRGA